MIGQLSADKNRWMFYLALFAIGLAGSLALYLSSPYGLGLVSDSVAYVNGAENIAAGNGYTQTASGGIYKPISGFPPMLSIVLAPISLLDLDVLKSARLLIVMLFGVDVILVGLLVYRISRSMVFSLFGAALLALSDILLEVYLYLLSEPLFITLMLAAFLFFSFYFDYRRSRWLLLSGLALGLATLTRLPGLWVLASIVLTILIVETDWLAIFGRQPARPSDRAMARRPGRLIQAFSRSLKEIVLVLITSLPLILVWVLYTRSLNTGLGNRSLVWHPIPFDTFLEGFKNLLSWLAPKEPAWLLSIVGRFLSGVSLLLVPGLLLYLIWQTWRLFRHRQEPAPVNSATITAFSLAAHVVVYMALMVVTISLIDASEPMNSRLLSVVYLPLIILFAAVLAWVWQAASRLNGKLTLISRGFIGLVCLGIVFSSVADGLIAIRQLSREGFGYANRTVTGSEAVADIRRLPPVLIYSNNSDGILLMTGKPATIIPTPIDPVTTLARPNYAKDVALVQQQVLAGQAVIILFDMNNKAKAYRYSIYQTLTSGLPLIKDYGSIQIFGRVN